MAPSKSTTIAAIVTAVLSLGSAGYQFNKAELAEMQSSLKALAAENKAQRIEKEIKEGVAKGNIDLMAQNRVLELKKRELEEKQNELERVADALKKACTKLENPLNSASDKICTNGKLSKELDTAKAEEPKLLAVYIQVKKNDPEAKHRAETLQATLKVKGYRVPAIELVENVPKTNQLRYVYESDDDAVKQLLAIISPLLFEKKPRMTRYEGKTPKKSVELWFSSAQSN